MMQEQATKNLRAQTQQLLDGPLKHIRGAALAAALLPLASIAATPAAADPLCPSAGVCGTVFNDVNGDGVQQPTEPGLPDIEVTIIDNADGTAYPVYTNSEGFFAGGPLLTTVAVYVKIPQDMQTSPTNIGDVSGSDGVNNGDGFSVVTGVSADGFSYTNFGFVGSPALNPGTGTPGYWKNHPDAWPVTTITVGGVPYTRDQAIVWLGKVGKDKTTTMFSSLVPAMLNVMIDNDGTCINDTIAQANAWMAAYGPVGSGVPASSYAWTLGEPLHQAMDAYNNGLLCAPHRK
ncbi:MAG TPA: SdrD B-like domain-containing protein [Vicinamibacterales bacterium]|jgi:hypothetical protein